MGLEQIFNTLITGRNVAIVGPAEYVCKELAADHGVFIDGHDVVIRLNEFFYCPEELEQFYGKKTNILSSSFWHRLNNDYPDPNGSWENFRYCIEEEYNRLPDGIWLLECYARNEFGEIYRRCGNTIRRKKLKYLNLTPELYLSVCKILCDICPLSKTPTTGLATIALVLLCRPKKLYVTGFTAYQENPWATHFGGYSRSPDPSQGRSPDPSQGWPKGFNGKTYNDSDGVEYAGAHHCFQNEAFILNFLVQTAQIEVDRFMRVLFESLNQRLLAK
jgi:hypothetical protein